MNKYVVRNYALTHEIYHQEDDYPGEIQNRHDFQRFKIDNNN